MCKQCSWVFLFMLILLPMQSLAQNNDRYWLDGKWPHEKSELPKHDKALYGRLDNGFRYIIQQNANPKGRVSMQLLVQAGSLMENDKERGIAHFLEHLAFNGSKNFPAGKLIPFFQSNGMSFGKDVNAHTSLKETVYKLNLLNKKESMDNALLFLRDVADGIIITAEEVEKERGVIISEKNSRDSDMARSRTRMRHFLFEGTEFIHEPIGTEEIIKTVSPQTIQGFYDAWYRPEYMVLMVVGSVEPKSVEKEIQQAFASLKARGTARNIFPFKSSHLQGVLPYYDHYQSETTTVQIKAQGALQWQSDSLKVQEEMLYASMATSIVSSRLRNLLAEGQAAFLRAGANYTETYSFFPSSFIFATTEETSWQQSFEQLQNVLLVALKFGFLPSEVAEAKKIFSSAYKRKVATAQQEQNDDIIGTMIGSFLSDRVYQSWEQTFDMYDGMIEKATAKVLHDAFVKMWSEDNRIISVMGSAKIDNAIPTLEKLWKAGFEKKLEPVQIASDTQYPYVALPQKQGTVTSQKVEPLKNVEVKLHEVTFKNGLIVRIIPTPYSEGKLSVSLDIGAGTSAIADEDFIRAKVAMAVDKQSGFGKLNLNDVRRLASIEGIAVNASLGPDSLTIMSDGESKDLEKNLEAMWTQYKDPSISERDRNLALRNFAIADAKLGKDLSSAAQIAGRKIFWKESLRNTPITEAMAQKYDLKSLQAALIELYSGGAPILNMVGDVNVDEAIALVGKTFGSDEVAWKPLPKANYDIEYAFASDGKREVNIEVDSPLDQAVVRLAYLRPHEDAMDRKTLIMRRLVTAVLGDVTREAIREKFGAAYSPSVLYWVDDKNGYGMYIINISTQHENFEQMRKEVYNLVNDFVKNGANAQTFERMKKTAIGAWQRNSKHDKTYSSLLSLQARRDRPYLGWNSDFVPMVESITLDEINAEIRKAFVKEKSALLTGITKNTSK